MSDVSVALAATNSVIGSVVPVKIDGMICVIEIEKNEFGDTLPIIQKKSRVEKNKILYHLTIKAKLMLTNGGRVVVGHDLKIQSNREKDNIKCNGRTNKDGEMLFVLESRDAGLLRLCVMTPGISIYNPEIVLKDAWYQTVFLITGYNVCAEEDFFGTLVDGSGLDEKHKSDFLFGAAGIPMQGTGMALDGRYIRLNSMAGGWHRTTAGHPDRVNAPASISFSYSSSVMGAFGEVRENRSIAVDPTVIPKNARVFIDVLGERFADDRGSAIKNYHIDNFLGCGKSVVAAWLRGVLMELGVALDT